MRYELAFTRVNYKIGFDKRESALSGTVSLEPRLSCFSQAECTAPSCFQNMVPGNVKGLPSALGEF